MERPVITAKVVGSMKENHWIDLYDNGWHIGSVWGKCKVNYYNDPMLRQYRLDFNDATFLWVDDIERKVIPVKEEAGMSQKESKPPILNDAEVETLIMSLLHGQGLADEDEMEKVIAWAKQAIVNTAILELVLKGELVTSVKEDGELAFRNAE